MKTLRRIALLLALAAALTACAQNQKKATLRVGMECDYAPYNWTQLNETPDAVKLSDGTYADGYDVQMAKRIAGALGMTLEIVKTEWDGLPPSLTSNKIDLILAGMTDTAERRETIDFTDVYWVSDVGIVVKKDGSFASAASLADFAGARLTGQLSTIHYDLIDEIPGAVKEQAMADFPTMLIALSSGIVDGYISERPSAISAQLSNPDVTFVAFAAGQGFSEEVPVSIGIRRGDTELKAIINTFLAGITTAERQKMMEEAVARQPLND